MGANPHSDTHQCQVVLNCPSYFSNPLSHKMLKRTEREREKERKEKAEEKGEIKWVSVCENIFSLKRERIKIIIITCLYPKKKIEIIYPNFLNKIDRCKRVKKKKTNPKLFL